MLYLVSYLHFPCFIESWPLSHLSSSLLTNQLEVLKPGLTGKEIFRRESWRELISRSYFLMLQWSPNFYRETSISGHQGLKIGLDQELSWKQGRLKDPQVLEGFFGEISDKSPSSRWNWTLSDCGCVCGCGRGCGCWSLPRSWKVLASSNSWILKMALLRIKQLIQYWVFYSDLFNVLLFPQKDVLLAHLKQRVW